MIVLDTPPLPRGLLIVESTYMRHGGDSLQLQCGPASWLRLLEDGTVIDGTGCAPILWHWETLKPAYELGRDGNYMFCHKFYDRMKHPYPETGLVNKDPDAFIAAAENFSDEWCSLRGRVYRFAERYEATRVYIQQDTIPMDEDRASGIMRIVAAFGRCDDDLKMSARYRRDFR